MGSTGRRYQWCCILGTTGFDGDHRGLDEKEYFGRSETGCKYIGLARGGFEVYEWKVRDMVMVREASGCILSWTLATVKWEVAGPVYVTH